MRGLWEGGGGIRFLLEAHRFLVLLVDLSRTDQAAQMTAPFDISALAAHTR